jgi:DNA-binding XRE family transcriptional regulator
MTTKEIGLKDIEHQYGELTFAKVLKSYRLAEDISQVNFAQQIGISKQSLNDLENSRKLPSLQRAIMIADQVGILKDLIVQIVLQDQVNKAKLKLRVSVESTLNKAS